jgi:hypothetical protein
MNNNMFVQCIADIWNNQYYLNILCICFSSLDINISFDFYIILAYDQNVTEIIHMASGGQNLESFLRKYSDLQDIFVDKKEVIPDTKIFKDLRYPLEYNNRLPFAIIFICDVPKDQWPNGNIFMVKLDPQHMKTINLENIANVFVT